MGRVGVLPRGPANDCKNPRWPLNWGNDPESYFFESYIQAAANPGSLGGPVIGVLIPLVFVWLATLDTLGRGVQKGIEKVSRIMMPVFFLLSC